MPSFGSTGAKNSTTVPKLGSTGGGAFIKPANLVGSLVIIRTCPRARRRPRTPA
jgi:hypothetical protein